MRPKPNLSTREESSGEKAEAEYYVLGGGHVGASVAQRLQADGHAVSLVDESYDSSEIPGRKGDPANVRTLNEAGLSSASTVVVATHSDGRNLLIAQLARTRFDVSEVVVLANAPARLDILAEAGHEPVCVTTALSDTLVDTV